MASSTNRVIETNLLGFAKYEKHFVARVILSCGLDEWDTRQLCSKE